MHSLAEPLILTSAVVESFFAASSTALLFFIAGKAKLNYAVDKKVYVVLEEDGTKVDEEEYFQTLPANTLLMLLYVGDRWSPFGPPFT